MSASTSPSSMPTRRATPPTTKRRLLRLRPGGLILLDNMLQDGRVLDESLTDESVTAIRALNETIASDGRVDVVLLALGDGVSVVQKR